MRSRRLFLVLSLLVTLFACNRDPNVAKQKYLESGNKYFDNGKYKQASIMYRKALSKDLKFGEAYYRLGLTELQLQNWPAAVRSLRRAIELQPANEEAHSKLGDLYMATYLYDSRRPPALLDEIRELADDRSGLLKRNPRSFQGLRLMGFVALVENDFKTALERFRLANEVKPFQPDVVLTYTQALSANNQWDEAEKLALGLIEKQPKFGPMYDVLYREYGKRDKPAEAEAILRRKVDNDPTNVSSILQLAAHYHLAKKEQEVTGTLNRILSNKADFPDGHIPVGTFYLRVKDFDKAIRNYQQGMQSAAEAQKPTYQKRMIVAYVAQNRKKEALELAESVLRANPKDSEALAMRGSLVLQGGNREQVQAAINDLTAAMREQPKNPVLRYELGRGHLAKGEGEQARVQFQEAVKLRPDYLPPKMALARLDLARAEYAKAMQGSAEILSVDPNNLGAKLIRSSALLGSGELRQARGELEALVKARPDSNDAQFQLAMLNFTERKFKDAENIFRRLHENSPGDPRGFMGMVESHMSQGRPAQALEMLQSVTQKSPDRPDYKLALANVAVRANKFDLAISEYQSLLAKNPGSADVHLRLGETYRRMGDAPNAIKYFGKARELAPNDPAANVQLALMLEGTGKRDDAQPLYEHVLKLDPDNAIVLNNLAYMLADKGSDLDHALTLAQRAKQKFPTNPDIADTLGWIYIKKNLSDNAISIFQELTSKHSHVSTYHYHLAMALFQKGDKPQAKKALETALKNKPSKEEEGKIKELMNRIG